MKVISFSVKNYRSITKTNKLSLSNYTVLVGPNNEGKSNLLRGFVTSLYLVTNGTYLKRRAGKAPRYIYSYSGGDYNWETDIPYRLREGQTAKTEFTLEFQMSDAEKKAFQKQLRSQLKTLTMKIGLGIRSSSFDIVVPGRAKRALTEKKEVIAQFIKERLDYQYIPCVRTAQLSADVLDRMVYGAMSSLRDSTEYIDCLKKIERLQQPILEKLSKEIAATVSEFVPAVKSVQLSGSIDRGISSRLAISVDDGTPTDLDAKGDGIKSLIAIALIKHSSTSELGKDLVLCIEEPESHLHPKAIHGIRKVLTEMADSCQIIISTHSPILVERNNPASNIIVRGGKAESCKQISQIRDFLGVQVEDNLVSAQFVILVEGKTDERIIKRILMEKVPHFDNLLSQGRIVFDTLRGGSKALYKASTHKAHLCNVHLVLDNDECGLKAAKEAIHQKVLDPNEVTIINCPNLKSSEIEDIVDTSLYANDFLTTFNVNIESKHFKHNKAAWASRVEKTFLASGAYWDESIKEQVKTLIADVVDAKGYAALHPAKAVSIDSLIEITKRRISQLL